MDYILTKTDKKLSVYNVLKDKYRNLQIQFLKSKLDISEEDLKAIMQDYRETSVITLYTSEGMESNSYINYSELDEFNSKYDYVVSEEQAAVEGTNAVLDSNGVVIVPATEPKEAVPEIRDCLITVSMKKLDALNIQMAELKGDVNNLNVAVAEMLGV